VRARAAQIAANPDEDDMVRAAARHHCTGAAAESADGVPTEAPDGFPPDSR
jgi:hypothetical protein